MKTKILLSALGLCLSLPALAQEYAGTLGVHQTVASVDQANTSESGVLNFKAGLTARFELMPMNYFRTGVVYNQRHFEYSVASNKFKVNFDYLDIPATYQMNFNEMVGVFGGVVIGVNINDDVDAPAGQTVNPDADALIPLVTAGVNLMFDDMIGFDFYYERGMGEFATDFKDYQSFGANFLYWF